MSERKKKAQIARAVNSDRRVGHADAIDRRRWRDSSREVPAGIDSAARHRGRDTRKCDKRQAVIIATRSRGHRPRISFDARGKGARVGNVQMYAHACV